tara:strand:- start:29 stop:403 length:375 start_codon:yes stop_codon:yes gene_type:complete
MASFSVLYTYINNERGNYIMNKLVITLLIVNGIIWGAFLPSQAKANDYSTAVAGHVIQNHDLIDKQKLMEAEINKIGAQFALEMISIMQKHMPSIIDGLMAEMRNDIAQKQKCAYLKDTAVECK